MKEYNEPIVQVVEISCEDIIQTSTLTDGGSEGSVTGGGSGFFS